METQNTFEPTSTFRILRNAAELAKTMKRSEIRLADALELLSDLLRAFDEYKRESRAEDGLPFPAWMYGDGADSHVGHRRLLSGEEVGS